MTLIPIIRDTREQNGWYLSPDHCIVETKCLETGDYSVAGFESLLTIERKATVSEIAQNITEKRFWRELERLTKYKYKFLICEFSVDDIIKFPVGSTVPRYLWSKLKVKEKYIMRMLTKIQIQYGVHVIYAGDKSNAERIGIELCRMVYEEESKTRTD